MNQFRKVCCGCYQDRACGSETLTEHHSMQIGNYDEGLKVQELYITLGHRGGESRCLRSPLGGWGNGGGGRRQLESLIFLSASVTGDIFTKTFNGSIQLSKAHSLFSHSSRLWWIQSSYKGKGIL